MMKVKLEAVKDVFRTDVTLNRVVDFVRTGTSKLPSAACQYLLDKVPIIQWLPRYSPKWIHTDFIAGLTIGVMLIPQALAYAKIATIPIEHGLYSSWLPGAFAVFMGTSKDLSTGPTSMLGLLTAQIVANLKEEGYQPADVASAVAFMVGVYALIMGLFGLGFLLYYVSLPVLSGFISATALVIGFGQVGSLVGLDNAPSGVFQIIGYVLKHLPQWEGPTCGMGFGTIAVLVALEQVGKRWGKRHFVIKLLANSRSVIVLVLFALISYLVNRGRKTPVFQLSEISTHGIIPPKATASALVSKVATRAFAPLVACSLEHLAVGKAFGRRNGYSIDQSQEFTYLGVTNIVNSFFGAMAVGGAMSRTAVNSECSVKSPLSAAVTSGFILLTLYFLSPALYWLPKATLAAIVIMAVIHLFGPLSLFYRFWRVSFHDFAACMVSFWVTIFVSAEIGIGAAVGWSIVYTMLRSTFIKPVIHTSGTDGDSAIVQPASHIRTNRGADSQIENANIAFPEDAVVAAFTDAVFFPNAHRVKTTILEAIQLVYPVEARQNTDDGTERSWSVAGARRLQRLRAQRQIRPRETRLAVVVWDFSMVPFVDVTGIMALGELKDEIRMHTGEQVQIRMVSMSDTVRSRFRRAKWRLVDTEEWREDGADVVYQSMERAIWDRDIVALDDVKGI